MCMLNTLWLCLSFQVRLLFEETFHSDNDNSYRVLCVDHFLNHPPGTKPFQLFFLLLSLWMGSRKKALWTCCCSMDIFTLYVLSPSPSSSSSSPDKVATIIILILLLRWLCVICAFSCHIRREIFNVCIDLCVSCAREGDTGMDDATQVLTRKNWKNKIKILHPVLCRSWTLATGFIMQLMSQPAMNSCPSVHSLSERIL